MSRIILVLLGVLVLQMDAPEKRTHDIDPYQIRVVEFELKMRAPGGPQVISSFSQKRIIGLGDAVSIAIIKLLPSDRLDDPNLVRTILPLLRDAFSNPDLISRQEDREPRVSLMLLRYLEDRKPGEALVQQIRETRQFLESQPQPSK